MVITSEKWDSVLRVAAPAAQTVLLLALWLGTVRTGASRKRAQCYAAGTVGSLLYLVSFAPLPGAVVIFLLIGCSIAWIIALGLLALSVHETQGSR